MALLQGRECWVRGTHEHGRIVSHNLVDATVEVLLDGGERRSMSAYDALTAAEHANALATDSDNKVLVS